MPPFPRTRRPALRSSLGLTRLEEILPADVLLRLRKTNSYTDHSAAQTGGAAATERFGAVPC
jgi:hypothetical protein